MGMTFTPQQQKVIDLRDRNLLVSAAAGSGKTAVLVERILQRITDESCPVDIDELLIVTFTNAAAAEMRERIGAAIEKRLEAEPENTHLKRQQTLLYNAQITTIDSFCLYVIRNYFHRIDLEPDFRVAEEGERKLLREDVAKEVLEEYYRQDAPEFTRLAETLATGKNDEKLKEAILALHGFAMSHPWPEEWLQSCAAPYQCGSMEEYEALPLAGALLSYLKTVTGQWSSLLESCAEVCREPVGPSGYEELLAKEAEMTEGLSALDSYPAFGEAILSLTFGRLPALRKFTGDAGKKEYVKEIRNQVKDSRKKLLEQFFFLPPEEMVGNLSRNREIIQTLVQVTLDFAEAFERRKREKNILDFGDMEHLALKILVDQKTKEPTQTALELKSQFAEIMVDEYQDSNYVQETILEAVARENNRFMVGDVKQSIYRFRMARPELFMEKYDTYTEADSPCQKIDLHRNFRSRGQVLTAVNDIFYAIMGRDLGNVEYDEAAALYQGMAFPEPEGAPQPEGASQPEGTFQPDWAPQPEVMSQPKSAFQPEGADLFRLEVLLADPGQWEGTEEAQEGDALEGALIAGKIRKLLRTQLVTDRESGEFRPVEYRDIVILLRGIGSYGQQLLEALKNHGIPAVTATGTGYFDAVEVQTVLNLLRLLDNPRQDIPMASVLQSYIGGLSAEDLAKIRVQFPEGPFYQSVFSYGEAGKELPLREKVGHFLEQIKEFRERGSDVPIHELLYQVMEETGYLNYVHALPAGGVRRANLEMLLEKAVAYEKTSYHGLSQFIRYINQLQKYEVDYGEAEAESGQNAVRIMTIHKSKGLEFPVVIAAGLGRQFNRQDVRNRMVLHPQYGIGLDITDLKRRVRISSLSRQILARQIQMENAGEELRVLYVALTRAREKLILTGTFRKAEEKLASYEYQRWDRRGHMGFLTRLSAGCYLDWVLPPLVKKGYEISLPAPGEFLEEQAGEALARNMDGAWILKAAGEVNPELLCRVEERLNSRYPYEQERELKGNMSVSELKHRAMDLLRQEEQEVVYAFEEPPVIPYVPEFMAQEDSVPEENIAALRGTAMHRVLECFDFSKEAESMEAQLAQLAREGRIEPRLMELLSLPQLARFLSTPLAERMGRAARAGKLYREKPFVMGKEAREVQPETQSGALVLVQGIIDAFFEEDGALVLVDYKTDAVKTEQELARRYQAQLELYGEALTRATGKPVREKLLYSFKLRKVIPV